jgi:hypothetical protein
VVPLPPVPPALPVRDEAEEADDVGAAADEEDGDDEEDDAWLSVRLAWSRLAWAVSTACCKVVVSIVANACPALTLSPTATSTAVTVPAAGKPVLDWADSVTVPVKLIVCVKSPVVAATVT